MFEQQLELFPVPENRERLTISEAFEVLWAAHLGSKPSGRTYRGNRKALCRSFGGRYMDTLTDVDFEAHRNSRLNGVNGYRKVSIGAVFHDHSLINILYNKCRLWKRRRQTVIGVDFTNIRLPEHNPTIGIPKRKPSPRRVIVSPDEFYALCQFSDPRLIDLYVAAIDTTAREGDILLWEPKHYNPYTDQIEFRQSKTGKDHQIPVTARLREIFTRRKMEGAKRVFNGTNRRKLFEEAREKAGLVGVQFRDLRKSGLNEVLDRFKDDGIASRLAGHASQRTFDEHYKVIRNKNLRPAVDHLSRRYKVPWKYRKIF